MNSHKVYVGLVGGHEFLLQSYYGVEFGLELALDTGDSKDFKVKWDGTYDGLQQAICNFVKIPHMDGNRGYYCVVDGKEVE